MGGASTVGITWLWKVKCCSDINVSHIHFTTALFWQEFPLDYNTAHDIGSDTPAATGKSCRLYYYTYWQKHHLHSNTIKWTPDSPYKVFSNLYQHHLEAGKHFRSVFFHPHSFFYSPCHYSIFLLLTWWALLSTSVMFYACDQSQQGVCKLYCVS